MIRKKEFIPRQELEKPFIRMLNQLKRLTLLIDDLLDVTRINAGKMEYHPERFDLVPFVQDIAQQLEGEANKTGSTISIYTPHELVGNWDRHRLEQVVVNLITNAIKYGNSQPIAINIYKDESSAVIEFKDKGIGISEDNLGKIFERFERAEDTKGISGLGLGLWIVKKILEGLGGTITVSSQLGIGSVFSVKIPLVKQDESSVQKILQINLGSKEEVNLQ
jgi:signal transduction histidine kinase